MIRNLTKRNAAKAVLRQTLREAVGRELLDRMAEALECRHCAPLCETSFDRAIEEACDSILDTIRCGDAAMLPQEPR
jgi:hypothetical protein